MCDGYVRTIKGAHDAGPWKVYTRWVTDSGRYNEVCNPIDYETEDALAEQERLGLVLPQPAAAAAGVSLAQPLCQGYQVTVMSVLFLALLHLTVCASCTHAPCILHAPALNNVRISVASWRTTPLTRAAGVQLKAVQRERLAQPRMRRPPAPAGSPAPSARAWTPRRTRPGLPQQVRPCLAKLRTRGLSACCGSTGAMRTGQRWPPPCRAPEHRARHMSRKTLALAPAPSYKQERRLLKAGSRGGACAGGAQRRRRARRSSRARASAWRPACCGRCCWTRAAACRTAALPASTCRRGRRHRAGRAAQARRRRWRRGRPRPVRAGPLVARGRHGNSGPGWQDLKQA
jgi:hypothetical protein